MFDGNNIFLMYNMLFIFSLLSLWPIYPEAPSDLGN